MKYMTIVAAAAAISLASSAHSATLTNFEVANYGVGSSGAVVVTQTTSFSSSGPNPELNEAILTANTAQAVGDSETGARHGIDGALGAAAKVNTNPSGFSYVTALARKFDILTYGGSDAEVNFNIGLDGSLQNTATNNGYSYLRFNALVFDITSFTAPVLERNFGDIFFNLGLFEYQVGGEGVSSLVYTSADDRSSYGLPTEERVDNTGTVFDVNLNGSGSFDAKNGHSYLVVTDTSAQARGDGDSIADGLNTGYFGFDVSTASLFSAASGSSLVYSANTNPAPVPLPASAFLLIGGIAGLGSIRRFKS